VRVCPARHSLRKPRNDSYNLSASNSPAVPSFINGAKKTPRTALSVTRENTLGHIQSRCTLLEKPRIAAHHMIWREILLQLLYHSGDEGDDHKWSIPSAVSTDEHKEITVRQILHHLGTFSSDEALESNILEFFAHRTALALSHARHSADVTDPSLLVLEPGSRADLLARLRFSTYTMDEQKIRPLTAQELQANVSGFLDLRPDRYALHHKSKHLAILEFTRAMDSSEDWEEKKDAEKRS
jgi:hypothetical protein